MQVEALIANVLGALSTLAPQHLTLGVVSPALALVTVGVGLCVKMSRK